MARASHPPAWYPDPGDPTRVRRWDGRSWTTDVRPLPDWLRTLHLSPGPRSPLPRTTRRLWAVSAVLLLAGAVLMLVLRSASPGGDAVDDARFLRLADERCAAAERDVIGPNRPAAEGDAEVQRIHAMAAGWEEMVDDLRDLDVRSKDAPEVERWLADWDRWTSLGRRYAAALVAGDKAESERLLAASAERKQALARFASVNGLEHCRFP